MRLNRFLIVVILAAANGIMATLAGVWIAAITVGDGEIHACVDCLGEGRVELAAYAFLQAGLTILLARVLDGSG